MIRQKIYIEENNFISQSPKISFFFERAVVGERMKLYLVSLQYVLKLRPKLGTL